MGSHLSPLCLVHALCGLGAAADLPRCLLCATALASTTTALARGVLVALASAQELDARRPQPAHGHAGTHGHTQTHTNTHRAATRSTR